MFAFFKKTPVFDSFEVLGIDFHSHLLPAIDDGAKTLEDSVALITQLAELGYRKLVTTPHINMEYYPNTKAIIQSKLAVVQQEIRAKGIDIVLEAAAEYYLDEHFAQCLRSDEPLLCVWNRHVLVEMSFFGAPPQLEEYLFRLQSKGYRPILAHPERYGFMHQHMDQYKRLKDMGCLFQVNILSLCGYYDRPVQEAAERLVRQNMVDYLGTDAHHQRHLNHLQEAFRNKRVREAIAQVSEQQHHHLITSN